MSPSPTIRISASDSTRSRHSLLAPFLGLGCAMLVLLTATGKATAEDKQTLLPKFQKIERVIIKTLTSEGINPNDLISQSNVASVMKELARRGWQVPDAKEIVDSALPDDSFLVRRLAQPDAAEFKKDVADLPGGYDRLDRLSRMWHGEETINALVKGPDGYKMIQYMTTTSGGANLGDQLSDAPNGQGFNKMTGRIYTGGELIGRIHVSYEKELKRAQRSN